MANNPAETVVKSSGDVYRGPLGTGAPLAADLDSRATLEADGWVHMGLLHEDGPSPEGFEGDVQRLLAWNYQAPARVRTTIGSPTITVPLVQWNQENVGLYFPGSTVDGVTGDLLVPLTPGAGAAQELLLVVADGTKYIGLWLAQTTPRPGGGLSFPGDDFSQIPVTFDVLSPDSGSSLARVIGLEPAESPA
jgi:hypothetical protein